MKVRCRLTIHCSPLQDPVKSSPVELDERLDERSRFTRGTNTGKTIRCERRSSTDPAGGAICYQDCMIELLGLPVVDRTPAPPRKVRGTSQLAAVMHHVECKEGGRFP